MIKINKNTQYIWVEVHDLELQKTEKITYMTMQF